MPDFDFVGSAYEAASKYQNDQELINWYCEVDQTKKQGDRGVISLYPTPGLLLEHQSVTIAEVRQMYPLPGGALLLAVVGPILYSINASFIGTSVGTLATVSGPVSISDNSVTAYIVDGPNRYSYNWTTNTFTTLSDGAFNGGTRTDIVDNFLVYNDPNTRQWGCTNVLSAISSALNFSTKDASSDNLVSLIVSNREIFLLGEKTSEVWIDVGSFPFPFQRIPGTSMQHGILAPMSLARLGESFACLSRDDRGKGVVIIMSQYQPKRISTFAVETAIAGYVIVSDAIGYSYQQAGHEFYVLIFPSADVTWVYDLATGLWHKRAWRDSNNVLHRHRSNCAATFQGKVIVGDWQNGRIYSLSQSVYTDNGDTIPCIRRCPHLTDDFRRVFYSELQLQFQPGVGLQVGQGSDPQAMLTWSDDGGSTFGNVHFAGLGKAGIYKNRTRWIQLGQARDRIFEVTVTDPVYRVVVSANLYAQASLH